MATNDNLHRVLINTCNEIKDIVRTESEGGLPVEYLKDLVDVMNKALYRANPPKEKAKTYVSSSVTPSNGTDM